VRKPQGGFFLTHTVYAIDMFITDSDNNTPRDNKLTLMLE